MDDEERKIVERARAGDRSAFEKIYAQKSSFVYTIAYRMIGKKEEAEEITQDVFLKIYHSLRSFKFESSLKTWIYRIAVNATLSKIRKMKEKKYEHIAYHDIEERLISSTENQLDHVEEQSHMIKTMLAVLNPDQRTCVILRDVEGLTYEEIARCLRININTVRTRLNRARKKLVSMFRKEGVVYEM